MVFFVVVCMVFFGGGVFSGYKNFLGYLWGE